jgi:methylenetetrahydrofolate dehydrogenase (NADP+)/methenyltetrahydrofolate cyclohydrolase
VTKIIDPGEVAKKFRAETRQAIAQLKHPLRLAGFLSTESSPSVTYANYTKAGCDDVGIEFVLYHENRLQLERRIDEANADKNIHGIIVYYPIFGTEQDRYIKDLVDHRKDIEGLNSYWVRKLYHNERFVDPEQERKAILPCTPLAVLKMIEETGYVLTGPEPLKGKTVTIFNRSEVVGRPLASMISNDGARVYSFDIDGPLLFKKGSIEEVGVTRTEALGESDIVITGVPTREFPLVTAREIKEGALCINFSTYKNFSDDIIGKAGAFVPRVGPMTVAMALRNTLRLYNNFHSESRPRT